MCREFTRKELYDLVWAEPVRTIAAGIGISDVALAKQCRKANIPLPSRGYWARKQAGKPTARISLPPRFPGASDRVGAARTSHYYCGSDWPEKFLQMDMPPAPLFDEEISAVEQRARKLVGKVRCMRNFESAHPLVEKLLEHDDGRRKDFSKWGSSYCAPKYGAGLERRRLLIINTLFMAAARLGCRPSMSTSKYSQDARSERQITITIGQSHIYFTIEPVKSKMENKNERLQLVLDTRRDSAPADRLWEDGDESSLESQISDVLVRMLVAAEALYRDSLVAHREWIVGRKTAAEAEIKRRKEEAERKARELRERLTSERIGRLLSQAKALDRANQIRLYVESVLSGASEIQIERADIDRWAEWARQHADYIDPLKDGGTARAVAEHSEAS